MVAAPHLLSWGRGASGGSVCSTAVLFLLAAVQCSHNAAVHSCCSVQLLLAACYIYTHNYFSISSSIWKMCSPLQGNQIAIVVWRDHSWHNVHVGARRKTIEVATTDESVSSAKPLPAAEVLLLPPSQPHTPSKVLHQRRTLLPQQPQSPQLLLQTLLHQCIAMWPKLIFACFPLVNPCQFVRPRKSDRIWLEGGLTPGFCSCRCPDGDYESWGGRKYLLL